MHLNLTHTLLAATAMLASSAMPAFAEMIIFTVNLTAAADSKGTGQLEASLDTDAKLFNWTITYDGLSGDVTGAEFHGPAADGAKAPVVIPISAPLQSPISASASLTEEQINQLKGGTWYLNIETAKFPDGEIRGQLKPAAT